MKDLDVLVKDDSKTVEIDGKEYKIATLNPYVLGQVIGYIKDKRRIEIAETAKALGETDLKKVLAETKAALDEINETTIDTELKGIDVMTQMVYYALKVYQPSLTYADMGKLLSMEHIVMLTEKITEGLVGESESPPPETGEVA